MAFITEFSYKLQQTRIDLSNRFQNYKKRKTEYFMFPNKDNKDARNRDHEINEVAQKEEGVSSGSEDEIDEVTWNIRLGSKMREEIVKRISLADIPEKEKLIAEGIVALDYRQYIHNDFGPPFQSGFEGDYKIFRKEFGWLLKQCFDGDLKNRVMIQDALSIVEETFDRVFESEPVSHRSYCGEEVLYDDTIKKLSEMFEGLFVSGSKLKCLFTEPVHDSPGSEKEETPKAIKKLVKRKKKRPNRARMDKIDIFSCQICQYEKVFGEKPTEMIKWYKKNQAEIDKKPRALKRFKPYEVPPSTIPSLVKYV